MKQNIYDDRRFFEGYARMRRKRGGSNRTIELPTMRALLDGVVGGHALDLGCGSGQLSFDLARRGAKTVLGVDLSRRMLALARKANRSPGVRFERAAMEDFSAPPASFDLLASSLAIHYVRDYAGLIKSAARWLKPGGHLVFSTEHPIITAAPRAWVFGENGEYRHWALDNYLKEGRRRKTWLVEGVVIYHRTLETLLRELLANGLEIVDIREPEAQAGLVPKDMESWPTPDRLDQRVPSFLFIKARKPARAV